MDRRPRVKGAGDLARRCRMSVLEYAGLACVIGAVLIGGVDLLGGSLGEAYAQLSDILAAPRKLR